MYPNSNPHPPFHSTSSQNPYVRWALSKKIPLLHVLVIAPFIAWVAFGPDQTIYEYRFVELIPLFLVYVYLWYEICVEKKESSWLWIHVVVFLPLLIARVLFSNHIHGTSDIRKKVLQALLFAALGYHFLWIQKK